MAAPATPARAQQAPLQDKPFAEHKIVLQLSDNDPKKQGLVISVANNLMKFYDPDKVAVEIVAFGPGIELLNPENPNRTRIESLVAQGARVDICLNTVDTLERDTGKRPDYIAAATPVQVGVAQILLLTENGYTLVRPLTRVIAMNVWLSRKSVASRRPDLAHFRLRRVRRRQQTASRHHPDRPERSAGDEPGAEQRHQHHRILPGQERGR